MTVSDGIHRDSVSLIIINNSQRSGFPVNVPNTSRESTRDTKDSQGFPGRSQGSPGTAQISNVFVHVDSQGDSQALSPLVFQGNNEFSQ